MNHKQRAFVAEYLIDGNATRAAKSVGYSEKTARSQGQRLLTNVDIAKEIEGGQKEALAKAGLTADLVRNRLRQIISFDVRKLYDENGHLRPIQDLDDDTAAAVNGIEVQVERKRGDDSSLETTTHKVKTVDVARAVELGMRHFGLGKDVHEHTGAGDTPLIPAWSNVDLARRLAFIFAGAGKAIKDMDGQESNTKEVS